MIGLISVVHKIVNSDNFIAYGASFATFELLSRICLFVPLPETFVASVCEQEYVQNLILRQDPKKVIDVYSRFIYSLTNVPQ